MVLVSLLATALAVLCQRLDWLGLSDAEAGAYDNGLTFFTGEDWFPWGKVEKSKDIVVIAIDDGSMKGIRTDRAYAEAFGSWPYSRDLWSFVFEHLMKEGAKAVVYDAIVDEPDSDVAGDVKMGRTVSELGVPYYVGFGFSPTAGIELPKVEAKNRFPQPPAPRPLPEGTTLPASAEETFPEEPLPEDEGQQRTRIAQALAFPVVTTGLSLPTFVTDENCATAKCFPVPPIEPLLDVTSGFGLVLAEVDGDGKMRRTRFAYTDGVHSYVTLPLALVADLWKADRVELSPKQLKVGERVIAINEEGDAEIDYGGRFEERFPQVSLISVLNDRDRKERGKKGQLPEGLFKDKIVLIGGIAVGLSDQKATPFSSLTPGVTKQAAVIQNLLDGRFITYAPFWVSALLAFVVALFSVSLIVVLKSTVLEIAWPLLLFFGFFVVTGSLLVLTKVHVLSAMPTLAGELASVTAVAFNHFFASKERERIRGLFTNYLAKEVVDELIEMPEGELPKLHGESREVTAYFSDIRGFSTLSEQYRDRPAELVKLLNRYLTVVTAVLQARKSCIDKYIGDAVVSIFGAPLHDYPHAVYACWAALEVQEALARLGQQFVQEGLPVLHTRIGINTDVMFVGNMGSEYLLDYTAIGDGMNLASRLEGANKAYGTRILIGPRTYELAKGDIEARELDFIVVPGKTQVVAVYELLAKKGQLDAKTTSLVGLYAQALSLYRAGQFAQALPLLQQALGLVPEDGPSKVLKEKCARFLETPPPPPWKAVSDLDTK